MAVAGNFDQTHTRKAMRAEMLDAETELALAYAWRDHRDDFGDGYGRKHGDRVE